MASGSAGAAQVIEAFEFDEFHHGGPQVIAVGEGLEGWCTRNWQRRNHLIDLWLIEEGDRAAFPARSQHAMLGCLDAPAGPALEQPAEVDRERALDRRNIEPGAVRAAGLQAFDAVLGQQRDEAAVDVCASDHIALAAVVIDPDLGVVGAFE